MDGELQTEAVVEAQETVEDSAEFDLDYTGDAEAESEVQNLNANTPTTVEEPAQAQPAEETVPTEEDDVESLRQQLAEANLKLLQFEQSKSQEPAQPQPQPQPTPTPAFPKMANEVSDIDFLGQEDHLKYLENREMFNGLLNKVATVAFNAAVMASQERILRQIPAVVENTASQQARIREITSNFYTANSDLVPYKPAVSMAAIKLHNDNPSMPLEELLTKAAEETRRTLRIRPGTSTRPRVPAQPAGSGRIGADRTPKTNGLSEQEQQILDLLS